MSKNTNTTNEVTAVEFIEAAFPADELGDGVVGICAGTFRCREYDPVGMMREVAGDMPLYVVVSTLDGRRRVGRDGHESQDLGRARANCQEAWLFVLDDIGTKSVVPTVEPSYKMQTSVKDGVANYQWGYFLEPFDVSTDAGVAYYEGACRAAGLMGISDPGMRGVYRICRVPGSLHLSGFRAEITSWNPERVFALKDLCADLGLDVDAAMKPVPKVVTGEDGLAGTQDVVMDWLIAEGRWTGVVNGDWIEIECPNAGEHTDGSLTAGYSPLDYRREGRQFKCFHGHCGHMDTGGFLGWVGENGGPSVGVMESFSMSEEVRERIHRAIQPVVPGEVVADMESGDARDNIMREWLFCSTRGMFFHFDGVNPPSQFVKPSAFNLMFQHLMPKGKRGGTVLPDRWWSTQPGKMTVSDLVWHPGRGQGVFVDEAGVTQFNQYRSYQPEGIGFDAAVTALWEDHLRRLFGAEAEILRAWMAWLVQHPEQRIGWAPVLVGPEGCGKSILVKGLVGCLGERYVAEVGPSAFTDAFNGHSEGKLLVVGEEIRVSGVNRYQILDSLKTRITNDRIDVRRMHQDRKTIINTASYLFCSNHDDCLPLDTSGRRWAVFSCIPQTAADIAEMGLDTAYFARLGDTIRNRAGAIYSWLMSVDVSTFDPKGRAPVTTGTVEMIAATTDEIYVSVLDQIENPAQQYPDVSPTVFTNKGLDVLVQKMQGQALRKMGAEEKWRKHIKERGWKKWEHSYRGFSGVTNLWFRPSEVPESSRTTEGFRAILGNPVSGIPEMGKVLPMTRTKNS